jgi:predicted MFS family arabinose efflux permease
MMPARQAIIPEMVSKELVMNAVALNTLGMNVLTLFAPALAGFLIDAFDFQAVYFTMTGLNVYAAVFMFLVPPPASRVILQEGNIVADIQDGFRYVRHENNVLLILLITLFTVVLSMPYQQLLPIFVDDILEVGATGMGVLMSVSGAGAMVGSFVLASLPNRKRGIIMLSGGLISGLALTVFAFSTSWNLSLAFIVFVGLGQTIRMTMSNALLQSVVEAAYMGRVMSIFGMQWGIVSLSTFAAGVMAETIPVQWVVGGFAAFLIVLSILAIVFVTGIRKLE